MKKIIAFSAALLLATSGTAFAAAHTSEQAQNEAATSAVPSDEGNGLTASTVGAASDKVAPNAGAGRYGNGPDKGASGRGKAND